MTWSYSGDPSRNDKDETRFILGDTDTNDQLLTDEEINFLLTKQGSPLKAAIDGANRIAAQLAKLVSENVGRVKVDLSKRYDQMKELSEQLTDELASKDWAPFAGGLSISGKDTVRENSDRVEPFFTRTINDFIDTENRDDNRNC